jgi:hypothetical protein
MNYRQSYKEKLELKKASLLAAGLVSERYSGVSSIVLHMTYYQRSLLDPILMKRTLSFLPANYAYFHMKCMKEECNNGGFDLAPVVAGLVKIRKKSIKGKIFCHGTHETRGHASISYEINIQYNKQVK